MPAPGYVPHIALLLQSLRITPERLASKSKVAIDTELLRALLQMVVESQPFSPGFYTGTYPDIAEGTATGQVTDLHRHMIEHGYFEGRLGAEPDVDEDFYLAQYPDIRDAIASGQVASAKEHYISAGAAEGRVPNPDLLQQINHWNRLLRQDRTDAV